MTEPIHALPSSRKPTPPGHTWRLAWVVVGVAILALLLVCVVLILVAAWRGA